MSASQREKAAKIFRSDPEVKIMVAGLKCGSLGLNLTAGNRVIIRYVLTSTSPTYADICSDPWWNMSV